MSHFPPPFDYVKRHLCIVIVVREQSLCWWLGSEQEVDELKAPNMVVGTCVCRPGVTVSTDCPHVGHA